MVTDINEHISALNKEKYYLRQNLAQVEASLGKGKIDFNTEEVSALFKEAGIYFGDQIRKEYNQLVEFQHAITKERASYLTEDREAIKERLEEIGGDLEKYENRRKKAISYIEQKDLVEKYKYMANQLVELRAEVVKLESQYELLQKFRELQKGLRKKEGLHRNLEEQVIDNVEAVKKPDSKSRFAQIREYFDEIIDNVLDLHAVLSVDVNSAGHVYFTSKVLDEEGNVTSADSGYSYQKLMCFAFDLALLRSYLDTRFPRFLFHDGVFEALDDRKKISMRGIIEDYCRRGIQYIVTLIDSDLPKGYEVGEFLGEENIVLRLHDEDDSGRLFRMKGW